ncbi:MAG: PD40 domain-containing protein [Gammaproteobacteria bacterium]|nr:PD40 domain-containing protein [Gammaproteobacteria bacterium]
MNGLSLITNKMIHSVALMLVVTFGVASIIASNGDNEPSLSTIVFHSDEPGPNSIYTIDASGNNPKRLTTPPAQMEDTFPVWSPDRKKVAFQRTAGNNSDIYLMNSDGSNQQNISNHPANDASPTWSPDGTKLAFASNREGNWRIYVLNISSNTLTTLTGEGSDAQWPTWSPNADKITYERSIGGIGNDIYVMTANDGSNKINLTGDSGWPARFPTWSPIEALSVPSKIAYLNFGTGGTQIWLMDTDGHHKKQLTFPVGAIGQVFSRPAWSPLGDRLVYPTDREGPHELYTIIVKDGSDITRVTHSAAHEGGPDW